jgi:hypothetical protein
MVLLKRIALTFIISCASWSQADDMQVELRPCQPEKMRNILADYNAGFDSGLKKWRLSKREGCEIKISDLARNGNKSLFVKSSGKNNVKLWQLLSHELGKNILPKENYVLTAWFRSSKKLPGKYGISVGMTWYTKGWKPIKSIPNNLKLHKTSSTAGKWVKLISKPTTIPDTAKVLTLGVGLYYAKGEGWIDDLGLYPASVEFSLKLHGASAKQVKITSGNEQEILTLTIPKAKQKDFSTKFKVPYPYTCKVEVEYGNGKKKTIAYPRKIKILCKGQQIQIDKILTMNNDQVTREAAREACRILKNLTGQTIPILTDSKMQANTLMLGKKFCNAAEKAALVKMNHGYLAVVKNGGILIAGTSPYYTKQGVYRFFKRLGVSFWSPGKAESYPTKNTYRITSSWQETARFTSGQYFKLNQGDPRRLKESKLFRGIWFDHTADLLVPYKLFGKTHPEYYSLLKNGKRLSFKQGKHRSSLIHLCMSNPAVQKIAIKNVLSWIRQQPDKIFFPVTQGDGPNWCQCPECRKLDYPEHGYSDRLVYFINIIAKAVKKKYPGKKLVLLAYTPATEPAPAKYKPLDNVIVWYAPYCFGGARSQFQALDSKVNQTAFKHYNEWLKMLAPRQMITIGYPKIYPYYFYPAVTIQPYIVDMKLFAKSRVVVGNKTYGHALPFEALFVYVQNEMYWNPNQDMNKLISKFMQGYYGAAAPYMQQYFNLLESCVAKRNFHARCEYYPWGMMLGGVLAQQAYPLFRQAEKMVESNPQLLKRIMRIKASLLFIDLNERNPYNCKGGKLDEFAVKLQEFLKILTLVYNPERRAKYNRYLIKLGHDQKYQINTWVERISGLKLKKVVFNDPVFNNFIECVSPQKYLLAHTEIKNAVPVQPSKVIPLSYFTVNDGGASADMFPYTGQDGKKDKVIAVKANGKIHAGRWIDNPVYCGIKITGMDEAGKGKRNLQIIAAGKIVYDAPSPFRRDAWTDLTIQFDKKLLKYGWLRFQIVSKAPGNLSKRLLIKKVDLLYQW